MKSHQYLAIGFRLLAIVLFVYSLRQLAMFFSVMYTGTYGGVQASSVFFFATAFIPLAVASLLWVFPSLIAKKIVPVESEVTVIPEKSFSILIALVLTVGLVAFFYALVDGIYWLTYFHLSTASLDLYEPSSEIMLSNKASMLATAFEFSVALFIILRARYVANFLYNVAR